VSLVTCRVVYYCAWAECWLIVDSLAVPPRRVEGTVVLVVLVVVVVVVVIVVAHLRPRRRRRCRRRR